MEATGTPRRINRETLDADRLATELRTSPRRAGMLEGLRRMLAVRRTVPGFSPFAAQAVEQVDERVLVLRRAAGTPDEVVAAVDVSAETVHLPALTGTDVLTGVRHDGGLRLAPHGYAWLVR